MTASRTPCGKPHPTDTYIASSEAKTPRTAVICSNIGAHTGPHRGYGAGMRIITWTTESETTNA